VNYAILFWLINYLVQNSLKAFPSFGYNLLELRAFKSVLRAGLAPVATYQVNSQKVGKFNEI